MCDYQRVEGIDSIPHVNPGTPFFNIQAHKAALDCGELLEKEVVDLPAALQMYEKAADFAQMDGQSQTAENKANIKVATLLAQTEEWTRDVELFEQVAES